MSPNPSHESNAKRNENGSEQADPQQNPGDVCIPQTQPTEIEQDKNGNQCSCEGSSEKPTR